MVRNNKWLAKRLFLIWQKYFSDVEIKNNIFVRFGRPAKCQLGRIKFGRGKINPNTYIVVNGFFQDPRIPEFIVDATLAHELCHYAHGFYSPHPKQHKYPHKGGVIKKEMQKRGLIDLFNLEKYWLKLNWRKYVQMYFLPNSREKSRG